MKNEDLYYEERRQAILDMEQTIEAANVVQYIDALYSNFRFLYDNGMEWHEAKELYNKEVRKYRELYLEEKYPDVETNPNGYSRTTDRGCSEDYLAKGLI